MGIYFNRLGFEPNWVQTLMVICGILFCGVASAEQIPMWKELKKTDVQLKADEVFIRDVRKLGKGSIQPGTLRMIELGRQFIVKNQPDMAIKRYNQAWLLSPNHPDIHWGYAVATHLQGKSISIVAGHFSKAERLKSNDAYLFADHGRILEQRGFPKKAIHYFKKSLAVNPNHRDAHVGMWLASKKLGDTKTAAKHRRLIK